VPTRATLLKHKLLLLLTAVIWGASFPAQQIGMEKGLGPMSFNALRFALGALTLLPLLYWIRRKPSTQDSQPFPWIGSLLCGFFLFVAAALQQIGLLYTSCANGGFITGFYILFVPLIGFFFGQRSPKSLWIGVLLCLIGLYLLSVTDQFKIEKGDLLMLICAFFWACQILMIGHLSDREKPILIALVQFTACALLSGLAALLFETFSIREMIDASWAVAYAGILSVGVAFTLQVVCQKHCPPAPAAIIMSLEAVFAALTGFLILEQILSTRAILGCVLCFIGMIVVQILPMSKKKANPA